MTNELIWDAVPSQRTAKKEAFATPVVTMSALAGKGAGRKFTFNKAAQEILEIVGEDRVSFGFTPDGLHIYIKKQKDAHAGFQLTKTCSFSDKKTFEFISKRLELNNDEENHFDITSTDLGATIFELKLRTPMTAMVEGFAEAREIVEFKTMHLGEVSDEELPQTPFGGTDPQQEDPSEFVNIVTLIGKDVEETVETIDLSEYVEVEENDEWTN